MLFWRELRIPPEELYSDIVETYFFPLQRCLQHDRRMLAAEVVRMAFPDPDKPATHEPIPTTISEVQQASTTKWLSSIGMRFPSQPSEPTPEPRT